MTTRRRDACPSCGAPGNGEPCDPSCRPRQTPQTPAQSAYEAWVRSKESPATLGQIAYEAFAASMTRKHAAWGMPAFADLRPAPDYQDAWEAAAQAVLALKEGEAHG
jgi:hypothetical protein